MKIKEIILALVFLGFIASIVFNLHKIEAEIDEAKSVIIDLIKWNSQQNKFINEHRELIKHLLNRRAV